MSVVGPHNLSAALLSLALSPNNLTSYILNGTGGLHYHDVFDDVFDDFKASLYTYNQPKNIVLMSIYVLVFLLSFCGNILVILVIVSNRSMRSVTNYFLLNLAVADLLVTFACIPLTMGEMIYKAWIYGLALCKATGYLQGVSIAASVLTIMGLALDRYLVLSHPVKSRRISTPQHARLVLCLIWLIAGGIMIPLVFVRHLAIHPLDPAQTLGFCHERWPGAGDRRAFDLFLFVFIYVVPGGVVTASYAFTGCHLLTENQLLHRQNSESSQPCRILAGRRRVARMLLGLAGLFAASWLPYHIVSLYLDFQDERQASNSESLAALSFALLLGHSHSAQNPILYCIMNSSLKRAMMGLLVCRSSPEQGFRSDLNISDAHNSHSRRPTWSFRLSSRRPPVNGSVKRARAAQVYQHPFRQTLPLPVDRKSGDKKQEEEERMPLKPEVASSMVKVGPEAPPSPGVPLSSIYEEGGKYRAVVDHDFRGIGATDDLTTANRGAV